RFTALTTRFPLNCASSINFSSDDSQLPDPTPSHSSPAATVLLPPPIF
ncbi:hypothetical protein A2U01_0069526, partial [Trifolium medium]|nr:hypothetical protein [Trifolium medium]